MRPKHFRPRPCALWKAAQTATPPKYVQIVCIHMFRIAKPFALRAFADPMTGQPPDRALEISDAAGGGSASAIHAVMHDRQADENDQRRQQPPGINPTGAEGTSGDGHSRDPRDQPRIAELR